MDDNRNRTEPADPVEQLVARYLDQRLAGREPDKAAFRARLATDAQRAEFDELLRFALTPESFPPEAELNEGTAIGPYRLLGRIGSGGMGTVWRARDTLLGCDVAIKLLAPERAADPTFDRRLERESRLLARLKHPSIVTAHAAGQLGSMRYLVMELVEGVSLQRAVDELALLRRPPTGDDLLRVIAVPPPAARQPLLAPGADYFVAVARVVREVCSAIAAAHAHGVLHRDLKPGNVMLTGGGRPVVLDFGIAASVDVNEATVAGGLVGSVPYLAPEQVKSARTGQNPHSDIYQLGLLLYELLTLRRCFPQATIDALTRAVADGNYRPPRAVRRGIPADLEAICVSALDVDPQRRPPSAAFFAEELDRWLAGRPIRCRPPSLLHRARLTAARQRRLLSFLAAALLVGAAIGYWAWSQTPPAVAPLRFSRLSLDPGDPGAPLHREPAAVGDGEYLGLEIDLPGPSSVLALSVVGPRADRATPSHVFALFPATESDLQGLLADREVVLGKKLDLGPGRHRVFFTRVDARRIRAPEWVEGLWVFCASAEAPWLERWIDALAAEQEALPADAPGIGLQRALELLPERLRGGPLRIGAADREALQRALARGRLSQPQAWPLADPRPIEAYFRVAEHR